MLGVSGFVAPSAAHSFMDAFAHKHNQNHRVPWITIDWDSWRLEPLDGSVSPLASLDMTPDEGVETFARALSLQAPQHILVSTADLRARLMGAASSRPKEPSAHPRDSRYFAPRSEMERALTSLWEGLLGIDRVGLHDNFFEAGGHSLLALELTAKLREMFNVEMSILELFEYPTIDGLARRLSRDTTIPANLTGDRVKRQGENRERLSGLLEARRRGVPRERKDGV
jgi:acyl carrier protein